MSEQRTPLLDTLWVCVSVLNRNLPLMDAADEEWRAWFRAHLALRREIDGAGELESRGVPRQIAYFRKKIEEVDAGERLMARTGYWNT